MRTVRLNWQALLVPLLLAVVLIEAIALFRASRTKERNARADAVIADDSGLASLRSENARLRRRIDQLTASAPAVAADPSPAANSKKDRPGKLERLRTVRDLIARDFANISINLVDRQGQITDAFADVFALTSDERAALQQALTDSARRIDALVLDHAKVEPLPDGSLQITVESFVDEGAAIHDDLMRQTRAIVGPERQEALSALSGSQLEREYNHFGAERRTIAISSKPDETGMPSGYEMTERTMMGAEGSKTQTWNWKSRDQLTENLGALAGLLPPEL